MTESLETKSVKRMLLDAEILGLEDHPATKAVKEMLDAHDLHGPFNGGAIIWWQLNKDIPEVDWPVGCCIGNDTMSPEHCSCWTPVFDLEQQEPKTVGSWQDCEPRDGMCGDCAYRPGSPERTGNSYDEEVLLDLTRSRNQVFFCHQGMRRPVKWVHPDGREVPGDPKDYKPPFLDKVPYQADGTPGLVCGGWTVLHNAFLRETETHPSWLQDLVDMQAAGEILPGGMVWIDDLPRTQRQYLEANLKHKPFIRGGAEITRNGGRGVRLHITTPVDHRPLEETPLLPIWIRLKIVEQLRKHPGRWARVYDGGDRSSMVTSDWFRRSGCGVMVESHSRRHGSTRAVYARHITIGLVDRIPDLDVLTSEDREEAL